MHYATRHDELRDTTHYATLGLESDASDEAIRQRWRQAVLHAHPDKGGDTAEFCAIQEAYAVLGDPDARMAYDRAGGASSIASGKDFNRPSSGGYRPSSARRRGSFNFCTDEHLRYLGRCSEAEFRQFFLGRPPWQWGFFFQKLPPALRPRLAALTYDMHKEDSSKDVKILVGEVSQQRKLTAEERKELRARLDALRAQETARVAADRCGRRPQSARAAGRGAGRARKEYGGAEERGVPRKEYGGAEERGVPRRPQSAQVGGWDTSIKIK